MFDLEQRIQQWRQTLTGSLGGRPEVIEELESHLREEMQRLVLAGQAPEQAWEAALGRLGDSRQLAAEFAKVGPAYWLPARLALFAELAAGAALAWFLLPGLWDRRGSLLACHVFAVTMGYTATFAAGALAAWSLLTRAVSGWEARRAGAFRAAAWKLAAAGLVLTVVGVLLGGWWARENLGRFWGWDPREVGGLGVAAWDGLLLWCLLRRPSAELAEMLLGVAGNIVVSVCWFGANLIVTRTSLHSYGFPPLLLWGLIGFVMAQLLLLGLAFVPAGRLIPWRTSS